MFHSYDSKAKQVITIQTHSQTALPTSPLTGAHPVPPDSLPFWVPIRVPGVLRWPGLSSCICLEPWAGAQLGLSDSLVHWQPSTLPPNTPHILSLSWTLPWSLGWAVTPTRLAQGHENAASAQTRRQAHRSRPEVSDEGATQGELGGVSRRPAWRSALCFLYTRFPWKEPVTSRKPEQRGEMSIHPSHQEAKCWIKEGPGRDFPCPSVWKHEVTYSFPGKDPL